MSTVDKRVVEMNFENKGFEKNIKDSQGSLREFDNALTTMGRGTALSSVGAAVDGLVGKFNLLGTIGVGALLKLGSQAVSVGQSLVKSLAIDQIGGGFEEYELKMNSIKIMLAGGKTKEGMPVTLDMVNKELAELNEYADQTIYSFKNMTANIGKFTNAGVDLETAVDSIRGISNVAALSGANSEEASRAMYNFAQALSAGYVKFIDWKSIENASMATYDFKKELLESGVAAGTLSKNIDGTYTVLSQGGFEEAISPTKMFNQSLEKQWMTTEVLTSTLMRYSDVTTRIGALATEAATKVRTFSQLMQTTKEAIGSGWAMSFEHIFGNYDEATELWSGIAAVVGNIVQKSSDSRNAILSDWKTLGGRQAIVDGLALAWNNLANIGKTLKTAFSDIFPPIITGAGLARISKGFLRFIQILTPGTQSLNILRGTLRNIFDGLMLAWETISSVFKGLYTGVKNIISVIPIRDDIGILGFFSKLTRNFANLRGAAKNAEIFTKISKYISDGLTLVGTKAVTFFTTNISSISEKLDWLVAKIKEFVQKIPKIDTSKISEFFGGIKEFFNKPLFPGGNKLSIDTKKISDSMASLGEKLKPLKDTLSSPWNIGSFEEFLDTLKVLIGGGIGVAIINFFKKLGGVTESFGSITKGFEKGGLANFLGISGVLSSLQSVLKSYEKNLDAKALTSIAIAIAILVASLVVITMLDQAKLLTGIAIITTLYAELSASMILFGKMGNVAKIALEMLALSSSILILALALKLMEKVRISSVYALGWVMAELVAAMALLKTTGDTKGAALSLLALAGSIKIIAKTITVLGEMDMEVLKQGLISVGLVLAGLSAAMVVLGAVSKKGGGGAAMLAAGLSITLLAAAMYEMAGAVAILGNFKPEVLSQGLIGLAAIMAVITLGMLAISNPTTLYGAAAMLIIAGALAILIPELALLGSLPVAQIQTALLVISGLFLTLGLAGAALTPVWPVLLAIGGTLLMIGLSMLAAGTGAMKFALAIGILGASVGVMKVVITALAGLLPFIAKKFGEAIGSFAEALGNSTPAIMEALRKLIVGFIDLIVALIPEFIIMGYKIIDGLLTGLKETIPSIIMAFTEMLTSIMLGLAERLPEYAKAGADLIIAFLKAQEDEIPRVIDAGMKMIVGLINGLAESIRENTPILIEALLNLGVAFLDGLLIFLGAEKGSHVVSDFLTGLKDGLTNGKDLVIQAVKDLGKAILNGIKLVLGIKSPSKEMMLVGEQLDTGLINGLKGRSAGVISAAKEVGESSINALKSTMRKISEVVDSEINSSPMITPVLNLSELRNSAGNLNRLLSSGQSYNLASAKMRDDKLLLQSNQNGSNSLSDNGQIINQFNLNGVTIRSDTDINKLAEELYRKQENAMRSRGIRPAYST